MIVRSSYLKLPWTHESRETVNLFAMPNLNADYTADKVSATKWQGDYPQCVACGRTRSLSFAVHHEPPRSKGSLLLMTDMGKFVVKPTLILLCHDCHHARHSRGTLKFRWEWDNDIYEERFWSGEFFYEYRFVEHDPRFWDYGKAFISVNGTEWEITR